MKMKVPPEFESVFQSVELTEREIGFLTWLAGWDSRTVENLKSLIQKIRATPVHPPGAGIHHPGDRNLH